MQILNDTGLTLGWMVGSVRSKGPTLTMFVKGTYQLQHGESAVPADEPDHPSGDVPYDDDEQGGAPRYPSDFVPFKPAGDLMIVGSCWPPDGKSTQCTVTASVGSVHGKLFVVGDRLLKTGLLGGSPTDPEPFEQIALRYENSFGGPASDLNPTGLGLGTKDPNGRKTMPNLMHPDELVVSARQRPQPAGFGPTSAEWEPRRSMLGTYDDAWLENRWPWFPEDIDWRYFNAANPRLQARGFFRGDEGIRLGNLHPEHQDYESRLPGQRVRLFTSDDDETFGEVALELDTVWIDMDTEKLVLVWRGVREIQTEFHDELEGVLVAVEPLQGERLSLEHYRDEYRKGVAEPEPEPVPEPTPTPAERLAEKRAKADAAERDALKEKGITIPDPPERTEEELAKEAELLAALNVELPTPPVELTREDIERMAAAGESLAHLDMTGLTLDGIELPGANMEGAILRGVPLAKANLSGANLKNAVFTNAGLENAVLRGATLDSADFGGANLDDTDLEGASVVETTLHRATLRRAKLDRIKGDLALFTDAVMDDASAIEASLVEADFTESNLSRSTFRSADLSRARFNGVQAPEIDLSAASLTEAEFSERSNFENGCFVEVDAKETVWEAAVLDRADFSHAHLEGADFSKASLIETNLYASELSGAKFTQATMRLAKLKAANLFEAALDHADLRGTDMRNCNLYGADTYASQLKNMRLEGANVTMTKLISKGR